MDFGDYIKQNPTGKKYVLVTIDPDGSPLYLSSARFQTLPSDPDLPNKTFSSMIDEDGVPRMNRQLRDMWGGGSVASWGPVSLTSKLYRRMSDSEVNLSTAEIYGKKVEIRLSGPNEITTFDETTVTLIGYLNSREATVGQGITLHVSDRKSRIDNVVPAARFEADDMGANFPSSNDGKIRQIVLGKWNNVPCTLVDSNTDTYEVSDPRFPVKDIVTVYNNGVDLSDGFTKDLANNRFTLSVPPSSNEVITAEVEGVKDSVSGDMLTTVEEFVTFLLTEFAEVSESDIVIGDSVPTADAQYLITDDRSISNCLDELASGVIGTWFLSALDKVVFKLIEAPSASVGAKLKQRHYLEDVSWQEVEDIYYRIPYTYDTNAASLTELGAVGDQDFEIWLKAENREGESGDDTILSDFPNAKVADPIQTPFIAKSDAKAVADRGLSLFGVQRLTGSVKAPYVSPALALLDSVNLSDAELLDGDCLVTEIEEDLVAATPTITLKVWK